MEPNWRREPSTEILPGCSLGHHKRGPRGFLEWSNSYCIQIQPGSSQSLRLANIWGLVTIGRITHRLRKPQPDVVIRTNNAHDSSIATCFVPLTYAVICWSWWLGSIPWNPQVWLQTLQYPMVSVRIEQGSSSWSPPAILPWLKNHWSVISVNGGGNIERSKVTECTLPGVECHHW